MRCFIAIELPEEVREELNRLQLEINGTGSVKASFNKSHHLTLKFLGEITPEKADIVKNKLRICGVKKFAVELDSFGVFPNESRVRVLWVGVTPENEIAELQKEIDEALQQDFPKEKQFKAHLTLARVKYAADKKNFLQQLRKIKIKKIKFEISGFKLMRSTLTAEGPVHDELAAFK
ncbi:RNA 2',3'-cyclic phosphodiesterase [Candidatus Woesearchaeota archaeon]|nr:RNA 2',3'-cyclic phosphodiesterase [Candidatus Woesearchaeota archaeon]